MGYALCPKACTLCPESFRKTQAREMSASTYNDTAMRAELMQLYGGCWVLDVGCLACTSCVLRVVYACLACPQVCLVSWCFTSWSRQFMWLASWCLPGLSCRFISSANVSLERACEKACVLAAGDMCLGSMCLCCAGGNSTPQVSRHQARHE
jgi:hypothetical protein